MIYDGNFGVSSQDKVTMHAMNVKVGLYGLVGCSKALCNDAAAEKTTGAGWTPERTSVGEEILVHVRVCPRPKFSERTLSMGERGVSSRMVSMMDMFGSKGGGFTSVGKYGGGSLDAMMKCATELLRDDTVEREGKPAEYIFVPMFRCDGDAR
jgi:hypothetical protein